MFHYVKEPISSFTGIEKNASLLLLLLLLLLHHHHHQHGHHHSNACPSETKLFNPWEQPNLTEVAHLPISCPLWARLQPPNQTHNLMPAVMKPLGNSFSGIGCRKGGISSPENHRELKGFAEEVLTKTLKIREGGLSSVSLTINQNILDANRPKLPL